MDQVYTLTGIKLYVSRMSMGSCRAELASRVQAPSPAPPPCSRPPTPCSPRRACCSRWARSCSGAATGIISSESCRRTSAAPSVTSLRRAPLEAQRRHGAPPRQRGQGPARGARDRAVRRYSHGQGGGAGLLARLDDLRRIEARMDAGDTRGDRAGVPARPPRRTPRQATGGLRVSDGGAECLPRPVVLAEHDPPAGGGGRLGRQARADGQGRGREPEPAAARARRARFMFRVSPVA